MDHDRRSASGHLHILYVTIAGYVDTTDCTNIVRSRFPHGDDRSMPTAFVAVQEGDNWQSVRDRLHKQLYEQDLLTPPFTENGVLTNWLSRQRAQIIIDLRNFPLPQFLGQEESNRQPQKQSQGLHQPIFLNSEDLTRDFLSNQPDPSVIVWLSKMSLKEFLNVTSGNYQDYLPVKDWEIRFPQLSGPEGGLAEDILQKLSPELQQTVMRANSGADPSDLSADLINDIQSSDILEALWNELPSSHQKALANAIGNKRSANESQELKSLVECGFIHRESTSETLDSDDKSNSSLSKPVYRTFFPLLDLYIKIVVDDFQRKFSERCSTVESSTDRKLDLDLDRKIKPNGTPTDEESDDRVVPQAWFTGVLRSSGNAWKSIVPPQRVSVIFLPVFPLMSFTWWLYGQDFQVPQGLMLVANMFMLTQYSNLTEHMHSEHGYPRNQVESWDRPLALFWFLFNWSVLAFGAQLLISRIST